MGQLYILIHRTACAFGPKSFSQTEPIQPRSIFQCKTTTTINFWARSFLCIIIQIATLRFLRSSFSWQINSLLKEQNLQDTEIVFRSFLELDCSEKKVDSVCVIFFILWSIQSFSHDTHCPAHCRSFATSLRFNGFFLCLCSPVLQKMLCGGFRESSTRRLELEDVNDEIFAEVLEFWCGKKLSDNEDVEHLLALAGIADRFQIGEIATSLEDYVVERLLRTSTCADVLATGAALGLRRAEAAARRMALERFDEVAATAGFLRLDEDTTYSILSHDALGAASEESALEAAAWWIAGGGGGGGAPAGGAVRSAGRAVVRIGRHGARAAAGEGGELGGPASGGGEASQGCRRGGVHRGGWARAGASGAQSTDPPHTTGAVADVAACGNGG